MHIKKLSLQLLLILALVVSTFPSLSVENIEAAPSTETSTEMINQTAASAIQWLKENQNEDGSWGTIPSIQLQETVTVVKALEKWGGLSQEEEKAYTWLQSQNTMNIDQLAHLLTLSNLDKQNLFPKLINLQNPDGGWGIEKGYESSPLDTALSLRALSSIPSYINEKEKAVTYILNQQRDDGSWGLTEDSTGSIYVTATLILAITDYQLASDKHTPELQLATRQAGEWLMEQMDKGASIDSHLSALVYQAALRSTYETSLLPSPEEWIQNQTSNGSWANNPFTTSMLLHALSDAKVVQAGELGLIHLYRMTESGKEEASLFQAYETVLIEAEKPDDYLFEAYIYTPNGQVVPAHDEGALSWNTENYVPGEYRIEAVLKDKATGITAAQQETIFTIEPTIDIQSISVKTTPEEVVVGQSEEVSVQAFIRNGSNIAGTSFTIITDVFNQNGEAIKQSSNNYTFEESNYDLIPLVQFTPDVTEETEFSIKVQVFNQENKVIETDKAFQVQPEPEDIRIDISDQLDKQEIYPPEGEVTYSINLSGIGDPQQTGREPVDLVLVLDDSGSMEWGDEDYSYTEPRRIDVAKEAAKELVNYAQEEDRVGLIEFSSWVRIRQALTYDKELVKQRIDETSEPLGGTGIGFAINHMTNHFRTNGEEGHQRVAVLVSDGAESYYSNWYVVYLAKRAASYGITIHTIGLGPSSDKGLLEDIANVTGGSYLYSPNTSELSKVVKELGGSIIDAAGRDVSVITTVPEDGILEEESILPEPYIVTSQDGMKKIEWRLDQVVIDEEMELQYTLHFDRLEGGEKLIVSKNTTMQYTNADGEILQRTLPDRAINVAKSAYELIINTNKSSYQASEQAEINVQVKNVGATTTTYLNVLAEITDDKGNPVEEIGQKRLNEMTPGLVESHNFTWNVNKSILAGEYQVRVTVYEGERLVAEEFSSFRIQPNSSMDIEVITDKTLYEANDDVKITTQLTNSSSNELIENITVKGLVNNDQGEVLHVWTNQIESMMPSESKKIISYWDLEDNPPGDYTVTQSLYQGEELLTSDSYLFSIKATDETGVGLVGSFTVTPDEIVPLQDAVFSYKLENNGNIRLEDLKVKVIIADPRTEKSVATLTDTIEIDKGEIVSGILEWKHEPLELEDYLVAFHAELANGIVVPLGSDSIHVFKPYELTKQETVQPRILIWAENVTASSIAEKAFHSKHYRLVDNENDFMSEMRSGLYNTYFLLGQYHPLTDHHGTELSANIHLGKNILSIGKHQPKFISQQESNTDENEINLISMTYGSGQIVYSSTDLIESMKETEAIQFLTDTLHSFDNNKNTYLDASKIIEMVLNVKANALPVDAIVEEHIPNGAEVISANGGRIENGMIRWSLSLNPEETATLTYLVRVPETVGEYGITTETYYQYKDEVLPIDHVQHSILVEQDAMNLVIDINEQLADIESSKQYHAAKDMQNFFTQLKEVETNDVKELERIMSDTTKYIGRYREDQNAHTLPENLLIDIERLLNMYQFVWYKETE